MRAPLQRAVVKFIFHLPWGKSRDVISYPCKGVSRGRHGDIVYITTAKRTAKSITYE